MVGNETSGNVRRSLLARMQVFPVVLAGAVGVVLTASVFLTIRRHEGREYAADLRIHAQERITEINQQADAVGRVLDQIRRFYYASNEVDPGEFTLFVRPLLDRGPTLRALLWAPRAAGGRVDVKYCETTSSESPSAQEGFPAGLDLAARGDWKELMDRAEAGDTMFASGPGEPGGPREHDVMAFLPVFRAALGGGGRTRNVEGFLVAVVSVSGLVREALEGLNPMGTRIQLYDESDAGPSRYLYGLVRTQTGREDELQEQRRVSWPSEEGQVRLGGRRWRVVVTPTEAFAANHMSHVRWWALAVGGVLTVLVVGYLALTLGQARRIGRQVEARTADLRREIANREKVEQALRLQKEQAQQYLDVAGVIMVVLDRQARVTMINRKGCQTLGRHESEILGADWFALVIPEARRAAIRELFDGMIDGTGRMVDHFENEVLDAAGGPRIIAWTNTLLRDEDGRVVGTLSSGSDVTEQRAAEDQRRHMEAQVLHTQKLESLGILAGGIAHDFNNILTAVLGHSDLALRELSPVSPARGNLQEIANAARRAADLCRQLLAYSGKGRFVVEPVDLSALIEEMSHLVEVSISKKVTLRHKFTPHLPAVEADATQMRQVVMNLITNASEAIGEANGQILVATGVVDADAAYLESLRINSGMAPGRYVTLEVSDSGCGMEAAVIEKVFDPFFSTKFAGRGLGLAAVMGIVRGHKGGIKVYSEPGKGTTFKVFLPACAAGAKAAPHAAPADAGAWRGSGTVLLADDEEPIRALGKRMLEKMGFTVLLACDGGEALDVYRRHGDGIACVILDLTMPKTDGEEAFRALRAINPGVRVILCSGYNEQEVTQRFVGKGLAGFIQKPFEYGVLAAKLREAIGE